MPSFDALKKLRLVFLDLPTSLCFLARPGFYFHGQHITDHVIIRTTADLI